MKEYRLLAAGTLLGLAVTACGSIPQSVVSAPRTATSSAAAPASSVPSAATPGAPAASTPATVRSSPSAAASTVWFDCLGYGQVKPVSYILTCADAGSVLDHLVWTSWTTQQAVATGVHELNNAVPNRAEGKFINYPAVVMLWRSEPAPGHPGERYFTRITVRYTGPRPPAYTSNGQLVHHPAEWTQSLGLIGP